MIEFRTTRRTGVQTLCGPKHSLDSRRGNPQSGNNSANVVYFSSTNVHALRFAGVWRFFCSPRRTESTNELDDDRRAGALRCRGVETCIICPGLLGPERQLRVMARSEVLLFAQKDRICQRARRRPRNEERRPRAPRCCGAETYTTSQPSGAGGYELWLGVF